MNSQYGKVGLSSPKYLNIACGGSYIRNSEWENVDYTSSDSRHVKRMNVLHGLKPSQAVYDAVYCSHFIEHIPWAEVSDFLRRCRRLTASNGLLRIVVPDAEFLLREFLKHKDSGNESLAEFAYVNFLDQCVRQKRGGRLGEIYAEIVRGQRPELIEYAIFLNGAHELEASAGDGVDRSALQTMLDLVKTPSRAVSAIEGRYVRLISKLLPRGFRAQNVSFADVGERHQWMYDFEQLACLLKAAGYSTVSRMTFDTSRRLDGLFFPLDVDQGVPRKGYHQLFVEAYP